MQAQNCSGCSTLRLPNTDTIDNYCSFIPSGLWSNLQFHKGIGIRKIGIRKISDFN